jgi:hypothetical protein
MSQPSRNEKNAKIGIMEVTKTIHLDKNVRSIEPNCFMLTMLSLFWIYEWVPMGS